MGRLSTPALRAWINCVSGPQLSASATPSPADVDQWAEGARIVHPTARGTLRSIPADMQARAAELAHAPE